MILLDANILLYAYDEKAEQHVQARACLEEALTDLRPVNLSWVSILAFLRISTDRKAFSEPLSMQEAATAVDGWLARPQVGILNPGDRHWEILRALLRDAQVTSRLLTDAHLAALAVEHGATLCTTDRDFARFPSVRTLNPLSD